MIPTPYSPYEPDEIELAREIASKLQDPDALPLYLQYAKRFQEGFLRRILDRVLSVEEHKIKKSRAALFTYLISQASHDSRH